MDRPDDIIAALEIVRIIRTDEDEETEWIGPILEYIKHLEDEVASLSSELMDAAEVR